jgi:hypothetical protein
MHRALAPKLHLQHVGTGDMPLGLLCPRGVPENDARRIAVVENGLELRTEEGVQRARLALHGALRGLDFHLGVRQDIEQIALVWPGRCLVRVCAPRDGIAVRVDERNEIPALGLREEPNEVPALFPVDLAERRERDGRLVSRRLPHGLAARETDGTMFLGDDLRDELREALHLARVRLRAERDVELLEVADRKNALPDELRERLLGLVVGDLR